MSDVTKIVSPVMSGCKDAGFNRRFRTLIDSGSQPLKACERGPISNLTFSFNFSSLRFSGRISAARV
jgi:hypothetical protein